MKWKWVYRIVVSVRKSFFFHHHHHLRLSVFKGNFLFDKFSSSSLDIGGGSSSSSSNGGLCRPIGPERQQQQQPEIDDWNVCACVCERERERMPPLFLLEFGSHIVPYSVVQEEEEEEEDWMEYRRYSFFFIIIIISTDCASSFPPQRVPSLSLSLSLSHTQVRKVGGANKKNQKVSLYKKEKKRNPKRFRSTSKADRNGFLFFFPFFFCYWGEMAGNPSDHRLLLLLLLLGLTRVWDHHQRTRSTPLGDAQDEIDSSSSTFSSCLEPLSQRKWRMKNNINNSRAGQHPENGPLFPFFPFQQFHSSRRRRRQRRRRRKWARLFFTYLKKRIK